MFKGRLRLVASGTFAALSLLSCDGLGTPGPVSEGGPVEEGRPAYEAGVLTARPSATRGAKANPGLERLDVDSEDAGVIYVPESYRPDRPSPFVMMLHGAGGGAARSVERLAPFPDKRGFVVYAPKARDRTWDAILGGFGDDVRFLDKALKEIFRDYSIDPRHLAIAGFSDGASYALSLGLTNTDLFSHVIAFSPGFIAAGELKGKVPVFISHGTDDGTLPIDRTSRKIVPNLEDRGYDVTYVEFEGPHAVPNDIVGQATDWFLGEA